MKYLFIIILVFAAFCSFSQDQIVTTDGDIIEGDVKKVGTSEIEYTKADNPDGPVYSIEKSEVLSIKYENGLVDKFEQDESREGPPPPTGGSAPPVYTSPEEEETAATTTAVATTSSSDKKGWDIQDVSRTFSLGYSRFILKSGGKGTANSFTLSYEYRGTKRTGVRYPVYLTLSNGFYSIATGVNVKIYTNDHPWIRGFIGPEFTLGYVTGNIGEFTAVGDFGIDINPIKNLNISFHPSFGYYLIFNGNGTADAFMMRINLSAGVNF